MNESQRVSELQRDFAAIYGASNQTLTIPEIIMRLDEQAGYLGKLVMEGKDCEGWLVKSLSWLFALANQLEIDLETAFLQKFPTRCGYCLSAPCVCDSTNKTPQLGQDREQEMYGLYHTLNASVTMKTIVPNLLFFSRLIESIYPVNFTRWRENRAVFLVKLAEERAEVIEAYRRHAATPTEYTKQPLAAELADYFAWLLAIGIVANSGIRRYNVQSALAARYKYGCPYCRKPLCECPVELRRGIRSDSSLRPMSRYEPDPLERLRQELQLVMGELRKTKALAVELERLEKLVERLREATQSDILQVLAFVIAGLGDLNEKAENSEQVRTLIRGVCEWLPSNWDKR